MSNIMAAIGRQQLKRLPSFALKRRSLAMNYVKMFRDIKNIIPLNNDFKNIVPHIFPVIVRGNKRDELKEYLLKNFVETGIHYKPNHLLELFSDNLAPRPNSENLSRSLLSLPLHYDLKKSDQLKVVSLIKKFFKKTSSEYK